MRDYLCVCVCVCMYVCVVWELVHIHYNLTVNKPIKPPTQRVITVARFPYHSRMISDAGELAYALLSIRVGRA